MSDIEQINDTSVEHVPETQNNVHESEARQYGWVPEEEFRGNPADWRTAEEFLERGKQINGYLRKDMDKLKAQLAAKDSELAEIKETVQEFAKFHQETEQRAYERALRELKSERREALERGDFVAADELEEQLDTLKEHKPDFDKKGKIKADDPVNKVEPNKEAFDQWQRENTWYGSNEDLTAYADGVAMQLIKKNPELTGTLDLIQEVEKRVKKQFKSEFADRRDLPSAVDSGSDYAASSSRSGKGRKSYNNLPADAKKACDRYVKQGLLTQAEYVAQYFENEQE